MEKFEPIFEAVVLFITSIYFLLSYFVAFLEHEIFLSIAYTPLLMEQAVAWVEVTMHKQFVIQLTQIFIKNPQLLEQPYSLVQSQLWWFRINMYKVYDGIANSNTLLAHKFNWPLQYAIRIVVFQLSTILNVNIKDWLFWIPLLPMYDHIYVKAFAEAWKASKGI